MSTFSRKEFLRLITAGGAGVALSSHLPSLALGSEWAAMGLPERPTLISGADLLTMDPKHGELPGTDVLIADGRIADIGSGLRVGDAETIDAGGMILMPGMIDGHRHVWEILDLGRLVATEPGAYNRYQEWKMRTMVSMRPEDHYLAGLVGGLQAIDSGVTTLLDYAHGQVNEESALAAARGLWDSGIAGWFAFQLGVSSSYGPGDTVALADANRQRVARTMEVHWKIADRLRAEVFSDSTAQLRLALAPSAAMGRPTDEIRTEWSRVRSSGTELLAIHLHKPRTPTPAGTMGHRNSGIFDLQEAGLLGPDFHITHGHRLTPDELRLLRDTDGRICATVMGEFPNTLQSFRGASVHGRARAAGVATGIGIDAPLMLPLDYFEHARAAYWNLFLEESGRQIVAGYTPTVTLEFVTSLGAKALRMDDRTGTISVGKRADLILLRTDRIGFAAAGSLADRVLTFASCSDIDSVWVGGQARKRDGKMLGVNWTQLKKQLIEAQEAVAERARTITFV